MPDSNPGPLPYKSGALPMSQQAQHISDITLGRKSLRRKPATNRGIWLCQYKYFQMLPGFFYRSHDFKRFGMKPI